MMTTELDELDEINLEADRSIFPKRRKAAENWARAKGLRLSAEPKWKRQLRTLKATAGKKKAKVTT